jgi:ribosomal protein L16 Arg81 hydroxylase
VTPLHHDTIMLFHTQIVGRKRWRLISPLQIAHLYNYNNVFSPIDLDAPDLLSRYPDFAKAQVLEVVAEPGDTVFLPLGWWHQVRSLDVSLSFSYSNLAFPNHYTYTNPEITDW